MKYLCFLSVVGACSPLSWEPWVCWAGGLLVIAIIWGHVPSGCFTPSCAHQHSQVQGGQNLRVATIWVYKSGGAEGTYGVGLGVNLSSASWHGEPCFLSCSPRDEELLPCRAVRY